MINEHNASEDAMICIPRLVNPLKRICIAEAWWNRGSRFSKRGCASKIVILVQETGPSANKPMNPAGNLTTVLSQAGQASELRNNLVVGSLASRRASKNVLWW